MPIDFSSVGGTTAPPPPPPPAGGGIDFSSVGGSAAPPPPTPPATQPSLLSQAASAVGSLPGVQEAKGVIKGGMQSAAGLMNIVNGHIGKEASPNDVMEYQQAHPGASIEEATQAAEQGYKGPTTQAAHTNLKQSADWLNKHAEQHGIFQNLGGIGENIAEFLTPEGLERLAAEEGPEVAGKVATYADRLKNGQQVASMLQKYPRIAKLVGIGLQAAKAGAETGAQTYMKTGGDTNAAEHAAGYGAAGGALIGSGAEALKAGIEHISPTVENIGGTEITRLASQHPHATMAQAMAATAEHNGAVQQAQQQAGKEIIAGSAKGAAGRNLEELNAGRTMPENPKALPASTEPYQFIIKGTPTEADTSGTIAHDPAARYKQTGTRVVEGKGSGNIKPSAPFDAGLYEGLQPTRMTPETPEAATPPDTRTISHKEPTFEVRQFHNASAPGQEAAADFATGGGDILTQDAATAKAHIASLNDALDNQDLTPEQRQSITAQRSDMQRQMREYHASRAGQEPSVYGDRPTFAPVDIPKAIAKVGSFEDAADVMEDGAKEVYNRLDDLTGGRFSELREENKRAWNQVANGGGEAAAARLKESQDAMNRMLNGKDAEVGDSVSQSDLAFGNEAWKKAQVLRDVHSKIENAFDTSLGTSDRANAYRGFNGNRLRQSLKDLSSSYGERPLVRVIGQENFDNLTRLADITRTQSDRAKFGGGVNHVAQWLISNEGKVAGGVATVGGAVGHFTGIPGGAAGGAAAGEAAYLAARRVMRAIATNPKVGKQMTYAIQYGARPQMYAPLIGAMVRENEGPDQSGGK